MRESEVKRKEGGEVEREIRCNQIPYNTFLLVLIT